MELPVDKTDIIPLFIQCQADSLIVFLFQLLVDILYEKEGILRDEELPFCTINTLLYILKIINLLAHVGLSSVQKAFESFSNSNAALLDSFNFLLQHAKENMNESWELKSLCNEQMVVLGYLSLGHSANQDSIRKSGLLSNLCNHPMEYLMEPLKHIYVPTLCCILFGNKLNIEETFIENSPLTIINYIQKQEALFGHEDEELNIQPNYLKNRTLSRTASVSSLASNKSHTTQESHNVVISMHGKKERDPRLHLRFPEKCWKDFVQQLNDYDGE